MVFELRIMNFEFKPRASEQTRVELYVLPCLVGEQRPAKKEPIRGWSRLASAYR